MSNEHIIELTNLSDTRQKDQNRFTKHSQAVIGSNSGQQLCYQIEFDSVLVNLGNCVSSFGTIAPQSFWCVLKYKCRAYLDKTF